MSRVMYKYQLGNVSKQTISMPKGAEVKSVQRQGDSGTIWVWVDPDEKEVEDRTFTILGTGQAIEQAEDLTYLGTWQSEGGMLVLHLFERRQDG